MKGGQHGCARAAMLPCHLGGKTYGSWPVVMTKGIKIEYGWPA